MQLHHGGHRRPNRAPSNPAPVGAGAGEQQSLLAELDPIAEDREGAPATTLRAERDGLAQMFRRAPVNLTLADLSPHRFTVVATSRYVVKSGNTEWSYLIEKEVIDLARERGAIVTGQRRLGFGVYELRAKRTKRGAAA